MKNRFLKFKIFCTIVLTILLLSVNLYAASDNSNSEVKEAVYLGVENYGNLKKDKDEKSIKNFEHKFFIDGQIKNFKIKSDETKNDGLPKFQTQNKLWEGYIYKVKIDNNEIVDAELLNSNSKDMIKGKLSDISAEELKVDGKSIKLNNDSKIYKINWIAGGTLVEETDFDKAKNASVKVTLDKDGNAKNIYITFIRKDYKAPVSYEPGKKTLKNFLSSALQPVGTTLYVYGGTWDWQDDGSSLNARTIGLSESWLDFFQYQDQNYSYSLDKKDNAKDYYPNGSWNQYYYAGIDCSGYVAWSVYNTLNDKSGNEGYVMSATKMAKDFASRSWGTYTNDYSIPTNDKNSDFKVGDIFSMNGHVWICLGTCSDGSIVIMHSTPSDSKNGKPGGGVQISGLGYDKNAKAYKLADYYMKKYYPEWDERYGAVLKNIKDYTTIKKDTDAGKFSWNLKNGILSDPDKYAEKSPEEILKDLFNEKENSAQEVIFTIDKNEYKKIIDGKESSFNMDVAPIIKQDRTLLPIRYLAESLGAKINWDKNTRTATFIKNDEKVSVQVDTGKILLSNGQEYKLQNKVLIKNDRILLSLTNISKLFKMTNGNINDGISQDIEWDGSLRTVSVKIK